MKIGALDVLEIVCVATIFVGFWMLRPSFALIVVPGAILAASIYHRRAKP